MREDLEIADSYVVAIPKQITIVQKHAVTPPGHTKFTGSNHGITAWKPR